MLKSDHKLEVTAGSSKEDGSEALRAVLGESIHSQIFRQALFKQVI